MTLSDLESSWKQLKGDVRLAGQSEKSARKSDSEEGSVMLKPSRHLGTFIRRRSPVASEQAGWTAAR